MIVEIFQGEDLIYKHINVLQSKECTPIVSAIIEKIKFEVHKLNAYITPHDHFGIWYSEISLIDNKIEKWTSYSFLLRIKTKIECDKIRAELVEVNKSCK